MHSWNLQGKNSWSLSLHGSTRSETRVLSTEVRCKANDELNTSNERELRKIIEHLKNKGELDNIVFKNISNKSKTNRFFLDYSRKILYFMPHDQIAKWMLSKYTNYSFNKIEKSDFNLYIVTPSIQTQGVFDAIGDLFSCVTNMTRFLYKAAQNYKNPYMVSWIMDVLTLVIELNDPFFWRPISMFKFLIRIYSAMMRYTEFKNNTLRTQSLTDLTDIDSMIIIMSLWGLPDSIVKALKQLALVTNKKLLDSPNILIDLIQKFLEILYDILIWLKTKLNIPLLSEFLEILLYPLQFVSGLKLTKEMSDITMTFQKDAQRMFDPVFREKIIVLYGNIKSNVYIQSLLANPAYKIYAVQFSILENMYKISINFNTTARVEPVGVIFEGKPGCGKSTMMNKFWEFMNSKGKDVYNHSCPPINDGKNYHDDYVDQFGYNMDDLGARDKSELRHLINFISCVKFPLDCAQVTNKNTKFFTSKLLTCTMNHFSDITSFTKADCISEPEALFRRVHVFDFDNFHFTDGKIKGIIKYKKFDHITHRWYDKFIGPNKECPFSPSIEVKEWGGQREINRVVAWLYSVINYFLSTQEKIFTVNTLSGNDIEEINNYVLDMQPPQVDEDVFFDGRSDNMCQRVQGITDWTQFLWQIGSYCGTALEEFLSYCSVFYSNILNKFTTSFNDLNVSECFIKIGISVCMGLISAYTTQKLKELILGKSVSNDTLSDINYKAIRDNLINDWRRAHSSLQSNNTQLSTDNDTLNTICKKNEISTRISSIKNKMRVLQMISSDGYQNVSQVVISGRRAIVQRHSFTTDTGSVNIFKNWECLSNNNMECNLIPFKVIKKWDEFDLAVVEFKMPVPLYKDATHSLFSNDLDDEQLLRARKLYYVNCEYIVPLDNNFTVNQDAFQVRSAIGVEQYTVPSQSGIFHPISSPGLCGSLVIDSEIGLCGVHVAGGPSAGFAFVYPKKILKELKTLLTFKSSVHLDIKDNVHDKGFSGLKYYNDVFPAKVPLKTTSLSKTELHDILEEEVQDVGEKMPPNFNVYGGKTLSTLAEKSFKPIPYIDNKAIEFGKKCIRQFLIRFDDLTDYAVIRGDKEFELSALNKDSVNGFGYGKEKHDYIDFTNGKVTNEFGKILNIFIQNCRNDSLEIKDLLFYEAMKDELRPLEKVDKPRTFRVAPLHHTFLVKKFLGKLFIHCKNNMWINQMALGMNPYKDWDTLYKKLKQCYINFDGDFGKYDGAAPAQVQDAIADLIEEFYEGEEPETLHVLLSSMIRTFVLIKEKLWVTTHSMPSGCWVTAFFNSLLNRFLTAMVLYTEKVKKGEEPLVSDFNKLVDFVMGDDKICGAPYELREYFNALTVKEFVESIGMEYTDSQKGAIIQESKMLHECEFLKRSFRYHGGMGKVVGPLSMKTLINTLRYSDRNKDYDTVMSGKMTAFQFEMYLHERLNFKNKIIQKAKEASFYFPEYSDSHIRKSMENDETYAKIMNDLGKNITSYL
jgi:hypothetical protein